MGILSTYFQNLTDKLDAYNQAQATYDKYLVDTRGAEDWYNHLFSIQAWNNHPVEWAASRQDFELTIVPRRNTLAAAVATAKAAYDQAKQEYDQAKDDLATPEEVAAQVQVEQANAALIAAQAQAQTQATQNKMTQEQSDAFRKKVLSYVIWGVGALVVIGLGYWAYKKYFKKS